jgi:AraC-like DNA-binding protein
MSVSVYAQHFSVTDDPEEFVGAPIGCCLVGSTFLTWCESAELQGMIVWGAIDDRAVREMMAAGRFVAHPEIRNSKRRSIVDCRDQDRIDVDVLLGFTALARERVPSWNGSVERKAIVVPAGLAGILIAGALPALGVAHPVRCTHDIESALEFVDHPAARTAHEAAIAIATAVRGRSTLLSRLRGYLGRDLTDASVEGAAAALGMSTRTLQRDLGRLDTSFSEELRRVRVEAAEALLVHSDLKIDAIANQVGFGTASRMSAMLRRERNLTASALRVARGMQRVR